MQRSKMCFLGEGSFERFKESVGERIWDVDAQVRNTASFRFALDLLPLGTSALAHRLQNARRGFQIERSSARLSHVHNLAFGLSIVRRGTAELTVAGRSLTLRAGDVCFLNGCVPFTKVLSDDYSEDLILAHRESFCAERQGYTSEPVHVRPMHGTAALLADHVQSLLAHQAELEAPALPSLAEFLFGLVDATFAPPRSEAYDHRSNLRAAQRERIKRYLRAEMHDPGLTPARVASAHRVSLRYLHGLFEDTERSLCETLLELRLQASRAMLESEQWSALSVGEIAYSHGFVSVAHFSRSFRKRFGLSPSEARERAKRPTLATELVRPGRLAQQPSPDSSGSPGAARASRGRAAARRRDSAASLR